MSEKPKNTSRKSVSSSSGTASEGYDPQYLVDRLEHPDERSESSALALNSISTISPESLISYTQNLSKEIGEDHPPVVKKNIAETLLNLAIAYPEEAESSKRGLTEAIKIEDAIEFKSGPTKQVKKVRAGVEGWIHYAKEGDDVPKEVVENCIRIIPYSDIQTLNKVILLFEHSAYSGKESAKRAQQILVWISQEAHNEETKKRATKSLARTIIEGQCHDKELAERVLKSDMASNLDQELISTAADTVGSI